MAGFYFALTDAIYYKRDILYGDDSIYSNRLKLHELIHKSAEIKNGVLSKGLLEGTTENLVDKVYSNQDLSSFSFYGAKEQRVLQCNLNELTSYKNLVLIIRQMEYLTGKDSSRDAIYGIDELMSAFSEKYGKILATYVKGKTVTSTFSFFRSSEYFLDNFEDLQNVLMKVAFKKEFTQIQNIADAKEFMQKLRGFETQRGLVYTLDEKTKKYKPSTAYKDFYTVYV